MTSNNGQERQYEKMGAKSERMEKVEVSLARYGHAWDKNENKSEVECYEEANFRSISASLISNSAIFPITGILASRESKTEFQGLDYDLDMHGVFVYHPELLLDGK